MRLLCINPNSSASVTAALKRVLVTPESEGSNNGKPDLVFFNPKTGPPGIKDDETARLSTECCWADLVGVGHDKLGAGLEGYDGFLICCFSQHPLIAMLRAHLTLHRSPASVLGMCEAGMSFSLLRGARFGVITSGNGDMVPGLVEAAATFLGTPESQRFAGVIPTGLGIVELQEGNREKVRQGIVESSKAMAERGVDVILLGCAAMSGMEAWVMQGARMGGKDAAIVVDGAKAGVELLVALSRAQR